MILPSFPSLSRRARAGLGALCAATLLLAGCATPPTPGEAAFELNIAHINDHHSQLEPFADTELALGGVPTRVELGGFPRQTALFKALAGTPHLLKLHAGDALTGSLYYTFFQGAADAALMNTVCFDAFALGNHEFDNSDGVLRGFLDALAQGGCGTAVLSANVVPALGTPLAADGGAAPVRPHTVKTVGGVPVGIVGLTTVKKTVNSSRPLPSTQFLDELGSAQRAIDELTARGVRHIVLLSHQGYDKDQALAARLRDVDVVIGGDSHSLLGDFAAQGVASAGPYPTVARNAAGDTVCIGHAWEYTKAFGLMQVRFDAQGRVSQCGGQASLVIGDRFQRQDGAGAWRDLPEPQRQVLLAQLAATPALKVTAPDAEAARRLGAYTARVEAEKARHIGTAAEALCLVRVPGEATNRSAGVAGCERAHTLARGSDAAQVVADAFLAASKRADVALENAGGVRVPVPAGALSMNTAFTVLPFSNVLVELDLTGAELLAALEDGAANHLDQGHGGGSHPYAAGLRWELDMRQPRGRRFANVQVRDKASGIWQPLDPAKTYVLVTHDFLASGRDGYATLGAVSAAGRAVNTYLLYTQTFVEYLQARGTLRRTAPAEVSHQKVTTAAGVVLP